MNMVSLPEFWLRQPRHIRDAVLRKLLDRQLGAGEVPPSALVKADRSGPVPASLEQEFILSRRDKTGMDLAWTMAAPPVIFDKVDIARLQHAIDNLVRRHPVLAARFEKDGAGWQMRLPAEPAAPVAVVKVPLTAAVTGAEAWVRRRYQALLAEPFDAVAGPLFRAELCTFAGRGVLLLSYCSLVADGESVYLLDRDLRALLDGAGPVSLPAPAFDYADYAATQAVERQAGHFDAALAAIAARLESGPPQAWADGRPPAGPSRLYEQVIGAAAGERLDRWAAANRTTGPAVLLSAFARLLHGLDG